MAWSSPPRLWLRMLKQAPNPLALQQRSRGAQTQSNSSPMSCPRTSEIRLPIRPALVHKCLQNLRPSADCAGKQGAAEQHRLSWLTSHSVSIHAFRILSLVMVSARSINAVQPEIFVIKIVHVLTGAALIAMTQRAILRDGRSPFPSGHRAGADSCVCQVVGLQALLATEAQS